MKHNVEDRLVHYFAGECSREEQAEIEAWIRENPLRKEEVRMLRRLWEATGALQLPPQDVGASWDALSEQLESSKQAGLAEQPEPSRRPVSRVPARPRRRGQSRSRSLVRIGVAVLVVAVVTFVALRSFDGSPAGPREVAMRAIATDAGQRARVRLSDGTQAMLNAESELSIPEGFGASAREVHLEGEAYFDVAPDEEHPFIVHAEGVATEVVGTKFNVGAYPEDKGVQVVVAEGKVAMHAEQDARHEEVVLTQGQLGRVSKAGQAVVRKNVDVSRHLAWTQGQLVFRDAPFSEVARELERWFDLRVRLEGSPGAVGHLNATFKDETAGEVIEVIAKTLHLRYEIAGRTVTFVPVAPGAS